MAKNKRLKQSRSYKVQSDVEHIPFLTIKGKFLQALNMGAGTQFEMIETEDMLIFRKMTDTETSLKELLRLRTTYNRMFNLCERHLENYRPYETVNYDEHTQFLNRLKEFGKVATTLYALTLHDTRKAKALDIINEYKRQLAWCEQSFYEDRKTIVIGIDSLQLEKYKHLLNLLRDCGKQLGIFTKRNLFSFKNKRLLLDIDGRKSYYPQTSNSMMVAEARPSAYTVDNEIANHPEKYSQA